MQFERIDIVLHAVRFHRKRKRCKFLKALEGLQSKAITTHSELAQQQSEGRGTDNLETLYL